jgi:hypothetical protein
MTQFSIDRRSLFKGAGALIVSIGIPAPALLPDLPGIGLPTTDLP